MEWKEFILSLAIGEGILGKVKREIPQFEILPSRTVSFWRPKEWRSEESKEGKDIIVVRVDNLTDNFIHEAAHARWTWRCPKTRQMLQRWGVLLNIVEDARVEYLASTQWGHKFSEEYPPFSSSNWEWLEDGEKLAWGVYIKRIASSTGKEIPPEWKKALELLRVDDCYRELIGVKSPEDMEGFLTKWWGEPLKRPGYLPCTGEEMADEKRQEKEIQSGRELRRELEAGGSQKTTPHRFKGNPPSAEKAKRVKSLLQMLFQNDVEKTPSTYGRYNSRRDMRGKEDCFTQKKVCATNLIFIVDTSASMLSIKNDVRAILLAVKELSKEGVLTGAVLFVGGGECIKVPLPTTKPIEKVNFQGGTNGYKKAVPLAQSYDFVVFLSDLAIDEEDRKAIESLSKKSFFLYGGPYYRHLHALADKWKIPRSRRLFAPTLEGAIKLLLEVIT
ncbi:MAG: hypothetical protein DSO03_05735 [Hadesarchaea archaeon]|nr:MAG: hypothetical protein DSO03_05735 [Hadesarchaea archaeon]